MYDADPNACAAYIRCVLAQEDALERVDEQLRMELERSIDPIFDRWAREFSVRYHRLLARSLPEDTRARQIAGLVAFMIGELRDACLRDAAIAAIIARNPIVGEVVNQLAQTDRIMLEHPYLRDLLMQNYGDAEEDGNHK